MKKKINNLHREKGQAVLLDPRVKTNLGIFSWVCLFLLNLVKNQIFYVFL